MLRTLSALQGVNVLSKEAQKKIKGRGPCGVMVDGTWCQVGDYDHDGATKDNAIEMLGTNQTCSDGSSGTATNWCCDSCYWNQ
jgi:hypothetical protein